VTSPWWKAAVVYQVYPRSFCDASGDGIGDLEGVTAHLDHLEWLGVDAVWLSPFYRSPMDDFGYDVSDYCDVDPVFGTLADFDDLVAAAHARGIKVIVDWVPNHTSSKHAWFEASRSSRADPKRDWYWWRDDRSDEDGGHGPPGSPGRRPNNWLSAFAGVGKDRLDFPPAWTWDERTRQWYLHLFLESQPDLNWGNDEVKEAMAGVLRFWLQRGVDGFRVDVVHALGKDDRLPDLPPDLAAIPVCAVIDDPSVHPIVAGIRSVLDSWPDAPERVFIGETVLPTVAQTAAYYGTASAPGVSLAFNFHPLRTAWVARKWRRRIDEAEQLMAGPPAWPTWVLSNHDNPRHRTRYGSEPRARAAAVLMLTLRGTPFLYAGEEIGLEDAVVPPGREVDPGGRDGCRAPIPWDGSPAHGWAGGADAWLPWPPDAEKGRTVSEQHHDELSTLNLYRSLIAARRGSEALTSGTFAWLGSDDEVLAYTRQSGDDRRVVAVNFSADAASVATLPGRWHVEVSSASPAPVRPVTGPGSPSDGLVLLPDEAVILRPERP
jgi:alpha-glucosidase